MSLSNVISLPLLQFTRRLSRDHRLEWWIWALAIVVALAVITGSAVIHDRVLRRQSEANAQIEIVKAASARRNTVTVQETPDFTHTMGSPPSAAKVVEELKQASAQAGATLFSVQSQEHASTVDQLGSLELTIVLKGSYSSDKEVLARVVERFPFATLPRMRMRRDQASSQVETTATLVFWGAPTGSVNDARR